MRVCVCDITKKKKPKPPIRKKEQQVTSKRTNEQKICADRNTHK